VGCVCMFAKLGSDRRIHKGIWACLYDARLSKRNVSLVEARVQPGTNHGQGRRKSKPTNDCLASQKIKEWKDFALSELIEFL